MRHARFFQIVILVLSTAFALQLASAPTALAADEVPASMTPDQWKRFQKLEPAQKLEIRDAIINENAKERCGDFLFYSLLGEGSACEDLVRRASVHVWPTAEHALGMVSIPMGICEALRKERAPARALVQCKIKGLVNAFKIAGGPLVKIALQQTPGGRRVLGLAEGGITVVKFIADPKSELESMANTAKAVNLYTARGSKKRSLVDWPGVATSSRENFAHRWSMGRVGRRFFRLGRGATCSHLQGLPISNLLYECA